MPISPCWCVVKILHDRAACEGEAWFLEKRVSWIFVGKHAERAEMEGREGRKKRRQKARTTTLIVLLRRGLGGHDGAAGECVACVLSHCQHLRSSITFPVSFHPLTCESLKD